MKKIINAQRDFFATGETVALDFRISQLKKLKQVLQDSIPEIKQALYQDLGRCDAEASFDLAVIDSIDYFIEHLPAWMVKKEVKASPAQAPAEVYIEPVPLGACLIISPWNYPIELTIAPLLGVISAGNTAIIKPSEYSPYCSKVLEKIINDNFPSEYLHVIQGGVEVSTGLLEHQFAHVFYTGGTAVGRKVYQAASKYLTPVVLELGGKSPCVIDKDIDFIIAARRILFAKLINSGQTCVAPDYCLVYEDVYDELSVAFKQVLEEFYPHGALASTSYSKVVSQHHLLRLEQLINGQNPENIICGGHVDKVMQKLEPCLLSLANDGSLFDNQLMQEEIFGPILPIIKYNSLTEVFQIIGHNPQPLALYVFSNKDEFVQTVTQKISSGGVCVNDIMVHLFNYECGFGGIGTSGLGAYHGELSFKTYSHYRTMAVRKLLANDNLDARFPPY